jgi:hypothetical protein
MASKKSKYITEDRKKRKARVLYWDIETSPVLARTWGAYEQNILWVEEPWHLLTFAYAWDDGPVQVLALPDYELYDSDQHDDFALVAAAYELFEQADIVVAHNGVAFDTKKIKARFIFHGFTPSSPIVEIDTLRLARQQFAFTANRLNDLCLYLGIGKKVNTGGIDLWYDIEVDQDPKAWAKMKKYNKQDVVLLRELFYKLRPWSNRLPNMATMTDEPGACPICGDTEKGLVVRGHRQTAVMVYTQVRCNACGGYSRVRQAFKTKTEHVNL